jgi:hypothetical protein
VSGGAGAGVALTASKGATLHRLGLLFVYAMLTMGISGSILALPQSLTNANVLGGFISAYFVITALTTVRPVSRWTRRLNSVTLAVVMALSLIEIEAGHGPAPPLQINNIFPTPDHHVVRRDCVRLRGIGRPWT